MGTPAPDVLLDARRGRRRYRVVLLTGCSGTLALVPVMAEILGDDHTVGALALAVGLGLMLWGILFYGARYIVSLRECPEGIEIRTLTLFGERARLYARRDLRLGARQCALADIVYGRATRGACHRLASCAGPRSAPAQPAGRGAKEKSREAVIFLLGP